MQRTSRFLRSTASESSDSNITVRTNKRSRASSVGGDNSAVNREFGSADYASKTKACSARCSMRLLPINLKNLRKPPKSGKAQRPNFRSLQNTVVLAPFHSLKKCFQTKLLNLFSYENMKNINHHKKQMAKKKNKSFEYDIIELNSSKPKVKREGKAIKKVKQKSKCANYCQCKKTESKAEEKMNLKNSKRRRKTNRRPQAPCISEYLKTKKRKLGGEVISPILLKTELSPVLSCYQSNEQLIFSHGNLSSSAKSSQSKYDSWETYSNPLTCKEQHMEGSLAVSTTSFDSYSEHFDKRNWDPSNSSKRYRKRGKCQKAAERVNASILSKLNTNSSKMLVESKSIDGETVNITGREPQIQLISSLEPNQHLQPLQKQNKAKAKKPEMETLAGYYLRSVASTKEKIIQKGNQELQEQRSSGKTFSHKAMQIEVATQVEGNVLERGSSTSLLKTCQESTSNVHSTSLNISSDKISGKLPLSSSEKPESCPRTISDMMLSYESPCLPRIDPVQSQVEEDNRSQRPEGMNVSGEHSDQASMELIAGLSEQLQVPTNSQQSQNKETDFIFGAKNAASKLGESCEFSFGLNWVFSDDDED